MAIFVDMKLPLTFIHPNYFTYVAHQTGVTRPPETKTLIKSLEDKIYNFIWAGPDKVARIDAKKPIEKGGLDLPDIYSSWQSFKISWFRRLYSTNSLWGKLFDMCLNQAMPGCTREMFFTKIGSKLWRSRDKFLENGRKLTL